MHSNGVRPPIVYCLHHLIDAGITFPVIYADPPWHDKERCSGFVAGRHFAPQTMNELCAMPIRKLASDRACLYLHAKPSTLRQSCYLIEAWGFTYQCSMQHGQRRCPTDHDERADEILIRADRAPLVGVPSGPSPLDELSSVFVEGRIDLVRDRIERIHRGPYLELFGKQFPTNNQWTVFGDRIQFLSDDELMTLDDDGEQA